MISIIFPVRYGLFLCFCCENKQMNPGPGLPSPRALHSNLSPSPHEGKSVRNVLSPAPLLPWLYPPEEETVKIQAPEAPGW